MAVPAFSMSSWNNWEILLHMENQNAFVMFWLLYLYSDLSNCCALHALESSNGKRVLYIILQQTLIEAQMFNFWSRTF